MDSDLFEAVSAPPIPLAAPLVTAEIKTGAAGTTELQLNLEHSARLFELVTSSGGQEKNLPSQSVVFTEYPSDDDILKSTKYARETPNRKFVVSAKKNDKKCASLDRNLQVLTYTPRILGNREPQFYARSILISTS